ncbi:hypothetical protein [Nocardioides sp. HB32]
MTAMATPRHRVSVAVAHAHSEIDAVADASVWSMDAAETTAALIQLTRLKARVAELEARVAEHADEEAVDAWAHRTRQTRPAVLGQVRLGQALVTRGQVRDALAAGDLVVDQAKVIVTALDQLPGDLDTTLVDKAERHLVAAGREHTAPTPRILGKRLMDVVAPELADAYEARQLEREEAGCVTSITTSPGAAADPPTCSTAGSSARNTTPGSTDGRRPTKVSSNAHGGLQAPDARRPRPSPLTSIGSCRDRRWRA